MWMICFKEWKQFFSNLTGYLAIIIFLLILGLFLFVFPDTSILEFGYASLDTFFSIAPYILLFLIPTITMRSMADEYKTGTFELLKTLPLKPMQIAKGKYLGCLVLVIISLLPTLVYGISIQYLSALGGIDIGAAAGSYMGLLLLGASYTAIGLCCSSFTNNTIVAFILGAFFCFLFFTGFNALSKLPIISSLGWDYYVDMLGLNYHYKSISRGVIDSIDIVYFLSIIILFLFITKRNIELK